MPLVYILMGRRRCSDYIEMWDTIKGFYLEKTGKPLRVKYLHLDMEAAAMLAATSCLPDVKIYLCKVHILRNWSSFFLSPSLAIRP